MRLALLLPALALHVSLRYLTSGIVVRIPDTREWKFGGREELLGQPEIHNYIFFHTVEVWWDPPMGPGVRAYRENKYYFLDRVRRVEILSLGQPGKHR